MQRVNREISSRIDDLTLERLKSLTIVEVAPLLGIELKKGKAMCFNGHDRLSPSFTVGKKKNSWKCYGCGEFGDVISLVQKVLSLDFKGACNWLRHQFCIDQPTSSQPQRRRPSKVSKPPAPPPPSLNSADPEVYTWLVQHCGPVENPLGANYLSSHGIPITVARDFGVVELKDPARAYRALEKHWGRERIQKTGLASNRGSLLWSGYSLLFPFYDDERVTYIQVRCLEDDRKFIGPKGVLKPIFNYERITKLQPGQLLHICEGIPDTLALEANGLHAIGILGATSFRTEWIDQLLPFDLVGVPDGDAAGLQFSKGLTSAFRARGKSIRFARPPAGMDACDVISKVINE